MIGPFDLKGRSGSWTIRKLSDYIDDQQYNVAGSMTTNQSMKPPSTRMSKSKLAQWAEDKLEDSDLVPLMKEIHHKDKKLWKNLPRKSKAIPTSTGTDFA